VTLLDLLVATTNRGKFVEVQAHLRKFPLRILSLQDLTNPPAVVEDGKSFEENAIKKARTLAEFSGLVTLADDSGLEVEALGGAPGIHSARYAGEDADDEQNNQKLLRELANVPEPKRNARFVCALALSLPRANAGSEWIARESCEGKIALAPTGCQGFGYDPLFFFPPLGKTFGEIERDRKATVSHRGKALTKLASALPKLIDLRAKP
jgi:XTP/dITP diphosphohydrolase